MHRWAVSRWPGPSLRGPSAVATAPVATSAIRAARSATCTQAQLFAGSPRAHRGGSPSRPEHRFPMSSHGCPFRVGRQRGRVDGTFSAGDSSGLPRRRDRASKPARHSARWSAPVPNADATKNTTATAVTRSKTSRRFSQPNSGATVMLPGSGSVGTGVMRQRCATPPRLTRQPPLLSPARVSVSAPAKHNPEPPARAAASPLRVIDTTPKGAGTGRPP